jgi:hypothetical protein
MHKMSNLNKFKDSYQALEKTPRLCFLRKNNSRIHDKCLYNFFWPKILPQTPYVLMCIKCMCVTITKCPIAMLKISKNQIFGNFGPLIEHDLYWIIFIIHFQICC